MHIVQEREFYEAFDSCQFLLLQQKTYKKKKYTEYDDRYTHQNIHCTAYKGIPIGK